MKLGCLLAQRFKIVLQHRANRPTLMTNAGGFAEGQ